MYPNMIGIYWRGLPANQDWFRVEIERFFEAIPRQKVKDIVSTQRPNDNKKTTDFTSQLGEAHSGLIAHKANT